MNEETEQFENRLRRQPVEKIPGEWRAEILAATQTTSRPMPRASFLSTLNSQLLTFFWPHPKAWAGLAAVWIFILLLNFSMRDKTPVRAEKVSPPSPEVIVELKKQQRMFAELMGSAQTPDADRPKVFSPRPRSERVEILVG
ncbi:MAG: hypothetical protein ABUL66_00200 [Verrucomicrobiota bacterium]